VTRAPRHRRPRAPPCRSATGVPDGRPRGRSVFGHREGLGPCDVGDRVETGGPVDINLLRTSHRRLIHIRGPACDLVTVAAEPTCVRHKGINRFCVSGVPLDRRVPRGVLVELPAAIITSASGEQRRSGQHRRHMPSCVRPLDHQDTPNAAIRLGCTAQSPSGRCPQRFGVCAGVWSGAEPPVSRRSGRFALLSGGAPPGIRTQNQWIKSPLLCR
jgi:hypothetical protein